jgi:hypothetical protein
MGQRSAGLRRIFATTASDVLASGLLSPDDG